MVAAAHAVDHRTPMAQGHSSRIVTIADAVGRRIGISSSGLEDLRAAAFLHDVGHMTLAVNGAQLEAPGHEDAGAKVVTAAEFAPSIVEAIRHHHARWDGTGNSEWVTGDSIPGMARVLAVAERYEAMTAGRGFVRLTPQEALAKVAEGSGTEFDPAVVDALGRAVRDGGLELNLPDLAFPATAAPLP
jgi:response regulator RpfG family c-di-GMP phosphodiesterase